MMMSASMAASLGVGSDAGPSSVPEYVFDCCKERVDINLMLSGYNGGCKM